MHLLIDDRSYQVKLSDTEPDSLELSSADAIRLATVILKDASDRAEISRESQQVALV